MKRIYISLLALLLLCNISAKAQESYADKVRKYIKQYYMLAIADQKLTGVPACVTLGQGVLETMAGTSDLMQQANNHFGVKCGPNWVGESITHDDEQKNECFRKYPSAADSYRDHSDHLKRNPRYAPLFTLSVTDYAAWAVGLKKCGYATNPQYAQQLVKIIEDYKLQEYTYAALDSSLLNKYPTGNPDIGKQEPIAENNTPVKEKAKKAAPTEDNTINDNPEPAKRKKAKDDEAPVKSYVVEEPVEAQDTTVSWDINSAVDSSKIVEINGMKAVYVNKGEMLLPYAVKYHLRYPRLLEMNDLPDGPAPFTMYIYLEKKLTYGLNETHTINDGETILMASQAEGMQLKKLMQLNQLNPNEEPVTGTVLELQKPAAKKPEVTFVETIAHTTNAIMQPGSKDPRPAEEFVNVKKPKVVVAPKPIASAPAEKTTTPPAKPVAVAAKPKTIDKVIPPPPAEEEDSTSDEDLNSLKADLDKEVYADDSKLPTGKPTAAQTRKAQQAGGDAQYYVIKKGDNLSSIARKNNITMKQLQSWNNNIKPDQIRAGDKLRIAEGGGKEPVAKTKPEAEEPAPAPKSAGAAKYHVIQKGETLSAIAIKNHITVKQLLKWNDIKADKIRDGQKLLVSEPGGNNEDEAAAEPAPAAPVKTKPADGGSKYYVIQKGDNLGAIARKNHVTVKKILKWNDIDPDKIRDGQKLRVKE